MDPTDTIERLASGEAEMILATVIVALCGAVVVLYRQNNKLQDKMLSMVETMGRENRELLSETNTTTHASTEIMRRAVMQLEARR